MLVGGKHREAGFCGVDECRECGDTIVPPKRVELGYVTCLSCGDKQARATVRTIAPMHKSNYMLFTDLNDLKGINNKGGFHR